MAAFEYRQAQEIRDVFRQRGVKSSTKPPSSSTPRSPGIPPETFEYRLGNRSALASVIDQYRVTECMRSGIRSDPNRDDDREYIVRLVGQVIRVSIETIRIVKSLPAAFAG